MYSTIITPPGPYWTSGLFPVSAASGTPPPIFLGELVSRDRTIVAEIALFKREMVRKSKLYEFHSYALCREVSRRELLANPISATCA